MRLLKCISKPFFKCSRSCSGSQTAVRKAVGIKWSMGLLQIPQFRVLPFLNIYLVHSVTQNAMIVDSEFRKFGNHVARVWFDII